MDLPLHRVGIVHGDGGVPIRGRRASDSSFFICHRLPTFDGPSYLDVTVTLSDNVVAAVTVEPKAENKTSRGYQERFAAAVPDEVVGKSLDTAEVGKLAGASTCPDGFNDAIAQIRDQARSDD